MCVFWFWVLSQNFSFRYLRERNNWQFKCSAIWINIDTNSVSITRQFSLSACLSVCVCPTCERACVFWLRLMIHRGQQFNVWKAKREQTKNVCLLGFPYFFVEIRWEIRIAFVWWQTNTRQHIQMHAKQKVVENMQFSPVVKGNDARLLYPNEMKEFDQFSNSCVNCIIQTHKHARSA